MGSVPALYTTGDNDPEIYPARYYRHYLYCDACGSFALEPWVAPPHHEAIERTRRRLALVALITLPLMAVAGWVALGFFPSPAFLLILAAGMVIAPVLRGMGWIWGKNSTAKSWRFVKRALLWVPVVMLMEWVTRDFVPPVLALLAGGTVLVGVLVARGVLGSRIESVGLRCRPCGATYAHGTPFFIDLDANPRHRTLADVPRPLGSSPFSRGVSVDSEPPKPFSRLPP